jgi:type IV pilus assembly protein PilA
LIGDWWGFLLLKRNMMLKLLLKKKAEKQSESGFTLVELLVVIIIIGILSAIALPTFLGQANKARESGAKTNLGAINRAQQNYRIENGAFSSSLSDLDIGVSDTDDYEFSVNSGGSDSTEAQASPIGNSSADLNDYVGCVSKNGDGSMDAEVLENSSCP